MTRRGSQPAAGLAWFLGRRVGVCLLAGGLLGGCFAGWADERRSDGSASPARPAAAEPSECADAELELVGIDDGRHRPLAVAPGAVHVLLVTSHECPIANGYAPTLRRLVEQFQSQPVRWYFVHSDPDLGVDAARRHAREFGLPATVLLDPHHVLITRLRAATTPEAFVWTELGVCYRGRIDDQWKAVGARRPAATQHDLAEAIRKALAGVAAVRPWPPAVGCRLPAAR